MTVRARRTYLEMRAASALRAAKLPATPVDIRRADPCAPALYRRMYLGVGAAYRWTDRAAWTDEDIEQYLASPGLEIWIARVSDDEAGFFELRPTDGGRAVEIAYFGLLPAFIGHGLGGFLLTSAARRAWELGPSRVWLHTCSFDHPAALSNYQARGFVVTREEEYEVD